MSESEKKPMVIWQGPTWRAVFNGHVVLVERAEIDAMGTACWVPVRLAIAACPLFEAALRAYAERVGPVPPGGAAPRGRTRTGEDVA